jgi:sigma-B regulation protein RsbU (phosphoserine phosphatase)
LLKARIGACLEKKRLRDREMLYLAQLAQANQEIMTLNERLQAENLRLSAELEVTRRLQQMMLPKEKELSQINGIEIAGFMEPADEVGGDYYDVIQHDGRVKIGIGDVTGHGLESGVLTIMVQTAIRTLIENNETDSKKFLEVLNRTIYKNVQRMNSEKNMTLSLVDYEEGKVSLSGQHEEAIIVRSDGNIERIDTIDLGFPLGLEENIADFVTQTQIHLNSGDVMILYTDGITEAENELTEQFGLEKLCEVVRQNRQQSASEIRKIAIDTLRQHIGTQKIYDDITLIILKQK